MYNLRYHVASLVAVFLALSLGLVLGGLAVGGGMVERQQGALVRGLQDEFAQLRDDNRTLSTENRLLTTFSDDVITAWAGERLTGHTVVVLTRPGLTDALDSVRKAVDMAGGSLAVVTMVQPRLGLDGESASVVTSMAPDTENAQESLAASLAAEWNSPETSRPLTAALVDAGVLTLEGLPTGAGTASFVLLAGEDGEADPAGVAILEAFSAFAPAVGAEMVDSGTGVASAAAQSDVAAMDTLGSPVGDYTLVSLLVGSSTGYYGTATGAQDPYPAISFR